MDRVEELLRAEAVRIQQELADHDPVAFTQKVVAEAARRTEAATNLHGGDGLTSCGGSCCEGFRRGTRMDEEDEMDVYDVQMRPWEKGFELHITGPDGYTGVTQSHGEDDAEGMVRDYIALDREIPADSFAVSLNTVASAPSTWPSEMDGIYKRENEG